MKFNELIDLKQERIKLIHYTWIAFFITFYIWFNMAPLSSMMLKSFGWMTVDHIKVLAIANIALTIPARILIGSIVDHYGPRVTFSVFLILMGIPCLVFAFGNTFLQLFIARLVLSSIGAGFVIGLRMITQWFSNSNFGFAAGIYAGWGNFGSAVSAMTLPWVATYVFGGNEHGWRYAMAFNGLISIVYGVIYYFNVSDYLDECSQGFYLKKPANSMIIKVKSLRHLIQYLIWIIPLLGSIAILVWRLKLILLESHTIQVEKINLIINGSYVGVIIFALLYIAYIVITNYQCLKKQKKKEFSYSWKNIGALNITYFANFGAELAVISILPFFYETIFLISPITSGLIASSFAVINLVARPLGGWVSDKMSSRKNTLVILMSGVAIGFLLMSIITKYGASDIQSETTLTPLFSGSLWICIVIFITVICSFFVQSAEGATIAMIPLINKNMTGQISGLVSAYGNFGGLFFLIIYSFFDAKILFVSISMVAVISSVCCYFFIEEIKK